MFVPVAPSPMSHAATPTLSPRSHRWPGAPWRCILLSLLCLLADLAPTRAVTIKEFPVTASSQPASITRGSDGNLWFTEHGANNIGRITPAGIVTEFPLPTATSLPVGITSGPDDNLWFAEIGANKIGVVQIAADIAASQTAAAMVAAGGNLTYTITITNNGPADATNVALTDTLPANTTFVAVRQSSGPAFAATTPAVGSAGTVTETIGTLANGSSATFTLVVQVAANTANNTPLNNTVTATSASPDAISANNSAVATTTVKDHTAPNITITSPAGPTVRELPTIAGKAVDAPGGTGVQKILLYLIRAADGAYFNGTAFVIPPKVKGIAQAPALSISYDQKGGNYARRAGLPTPAELIPGAYRILAIAIDGASNRGQATRSFSVLAPASTVALSTAMASVAGNSVTLRFGGALQAESASDAAHYMVEVNGKAVTVERAGYNATSHTVTLDLASGALKSGAQVEVKWSGLSDSAGHAVAGQSDAVTAR